MDVEVEQGAGFASRLVDQKVVESVMLRSDCVRTTHVGNDQVFLLSVEELRVSHLYVHEVVDTGRPEFCKLGSTFAEKSSDVVSLFTLG